MFNDYVGWIGGAALGALVVPRVLQRLQLSRAKHRSLGGHPRISLRIARLLPFYAYDEADALRLDGAPASVVEQRERALRRLGELSVRGHERSLKLSREVEGGIADLQFINAYRVPFQFRDLVRRYLPSGSFVASTQGLKVTDLDGNVAYDLTGSFGVNVFGNDCYKRWIEEGCRLVAELGPVLGAYHPVVADNVHRLRALSGKSQVSFHMSGTEAVMQAVRLARYHTGRRRIVRFCGAYHGWWGEVQPGIGNPLPAAETFSLQDMSEASLQVLRRRRDIACVLVNPLQALHPNRNAPGDSALVDGSRRAGFDREAYARWLQALRQVCSERGIALIFDEVFMGFRLARDGAQGYFGVSADLVTYGKTVGGGLPVGVVCGDERWMKRFRDEAPADICFARGTFNSHPYVMAAMNRFLLHIDSPQVQSLYLAQDAIWNERSEQLNRRLEQAGLPVRVANMTSVWTVDYLVPSRYHWMFQYYLRQQGLALSWVGTGRMIFCIDTPAQDFEVICERFVAAAFQMQADGWWWWDEQTSNRQIRRGLLLESLRHKLGLSGLRREPAAALPDPVARS